MSTFPTYKLTSMMKNKLDMLNLGYWLGQGLNESESEPEPEKIELPALEEPVPDLTPQYVTAVDPYGNLQEKTKASIFKITGDGHLELCNTPDEQ